MKSTHTLLSPSGFTNVTLSSNIYYKTTGQQMNVNLIIFFNSKRYKVLSTECSTQNLSIKSNILTTGTQYKQ
jgi:hypothetical protein